MDPEDPLVNRLLRMMATQAMSEALYFSTGAESQDQYYHYGMSVILCFSGTEHYNHMNLHNLFDAAVVNELH